MIGSDIYVFWKNSTGGCVVSRRMTNAYAMPVLSQHQNSSIITNANLSPSPNKISCSISRPYSDVPILSDSSKFIWAIGNGVAQPDASDSSFSRHSLKGRLDYAVGNDASQSDASDSLSSKDSLVPRKIMKRGKGDNSAAEYEISKGWSNFQSTKFFDHIEKVTFILIWIILI
jgi:hypothetical protein